MVDVIKGSFRLTLLILRSVGLYHEGEKSILRKFRTYFIYFGSWSLLLLIVVTFIVEGNMSVQDRTQLLLAGTEALGGCLKLVPFLVDPDRMKNCIEFLNREEFKPKSQNGRSILLDYINTCRLITKVHLSALVATDILWMVLPLFQEGRKLPVNVWLPYDSSNTGIFCATYFYIFVSCTYLGPLPFSIDQLIAGLAYHARGQLKILISDLRRLDQFQDETINFEQVSDILKDCVVHHGNILKFVKEFESCFSWCIFFEIAASIFGMCFCCIGLTTVPLLSVDAVAFALSYLIVALEILFYCYFGSLLYEENEQLITSIYTSEWYRYDVRIRKFLIIMMERAKVPVALTAGKIIELNLATFTSVMKSSYSLIAVLNRQ